MTSLRALTVLVPSLIVLAAAPRAHAADYVGPESCRTCHMEAYRIWQASPHARAAETLTADQRRQPLCLQCHSRDETRAGAAEVVGVSCETCHGAGRYYQPAVVMRDKELSRMFGLQDTAAATCKTCHGESAPSARPFDPKEALTRIDHWTADRAARGLPPRATDPKGAPEAEEKKRSAAAHAWVHPPIGGAASVPRAANPHAALPHAPVPPAAAPAESRLAAWLRKPAR